MSEPEALWQRAKTEIDFRAAETGSEAWIALQRVIALHRPAGSMADPKCAQCVGDLSPRLLLEDWPCETARIVLSALGSLGEQETT